MKTKKPKRPKKPKRLPAPRCKGVIIHVGVFEPDDDKALALAKRVIEKRLRKTGWQVRPLGPGARDFLAQRPGKPFIGIGQAWDYVTRLKKDRDVRSAEPALILPGMELDPTAFEYSLTDRERAAMISGAETPPLKCAKEHDWSLAQCRIPEAWDLPLETHGKRYGEGIVVGHPDTGYTKHREIWSSDPSQNRLLIESGWNFVENRQDALDPLTDGWTKQPGHGTATASVVMSGAAASDSGDSIVGAAPLAKLVPLRVTESVALSDFTALAEGIRFAADRGYHAISISLGGLFGSGALQRAIQYAVSKGLIILAAAGNHVLWYKSVVYPAVYDEVIAVAACNCRNEPWEDSCSGPEVDVTAPGESVWVARTGKEPGPEDDHVATGNGTSFAVATTAGTCALWLAYHGWDNLVGRYGASRLASVFKEMLIKHGVDTPNGWQTEKYGAGILNALKLLSAKMPDTPPAVDMGIRASAIPAKTSEIDDFMRYFPGIDRSTVSRGLAHFLKTDEEQLGSILDEHRDELLFHIATNPDIRSLITEPPRALRVRETIKSRITRSSGFRRTASRRLARVAQ